MRERSVCCPVSKRLDREVVNDGAAREEMVGSLGNSHTYLWR